MIRGHISWNAGMVVLHFMQAARHIQMAFASPGLQVLHWLLAEPGAGDTGNEYC